MSNNANLTLQTLGVCRDVPQPGVQLLHLRPQLRHGGVCIRAALLCLVAVPLRCLRCLLPCLLGLSSGLLQLAFQLGVATLLLCDSCFCG